MSRVCCNLNTFKRSSAPTYKQVIRECKKTTKTLNNHYQRYAFARAPGPLYNGSAFDFTLFKVLKTTDYDKQKEEIVMVYLLFFFYRVLDTSEQESLKIQKQKRAALAKLER